MGSDKTKTVMLTLGRLPVALDLARGFHADGWRVVIAESQRPSLCAMSIAVDRVVRVPSPANGRAAYLDALRAAISEQEVDLVVPVSEETMTVASLVGDGRVPVFCGEARSVLALHDKLTFNKLATGFGMPVPQSWSSRETPPSALETSATKRWIVKPRFTASGRGMRIVDSEDDLPSDSSVLVQEFVAGDELSGFALAVEGRITASVVYRSLVNSGSVAVGFERLRNESGIEKWMSDFVELVGHTGFIAFDFIVDDEGVPQAIECNPRATSGLHFFRTEDIAGLIGGTRPSSEPPRFRDATRMVESYSCFTAFLGSLGSGDRRRSAWRALRAAKDVCWDRADPKPFLLMMINTGPIIWSSLTGRQSFAEAAVRDIEWRDDTG